MTSLSLATATTSGVIVGNSFDLDDALNGRADRALGGRLARLRHHRTLPVYVSQ
jgi:hypothetical protein